MDKPEALRLADGLQHQAVWERHYGPSHLRDLLLQAEAELRRLHAVNAELTENLEKKSVAIQRIWKERDELRKVNAELLEALRDIGEYRGEGPSYTTPWQDIVRNLGEIARAAIAKAEGQK